jgi:hypothetical protein
MVVRTMLLYGSCSVSDTPDVWQWVRSINDDGFSAPSARIDRDQSRRAARSFATSMKRFMPMPKKNDRRGANSSIGSPRSIAAPTYSSPSASVKPSSWTAVAPASCMW